MRLIQKSLPLLLLVFMGLTACDDNSSSGNNGNGATPASGTWKVSYFFDKQDETSYYNNYTFEFGANGSLSATNGSQTWTGTWATGFDDSANKFLIDFNGSVPSALGELEEDWRIIQMDANFMHFEHTSGGNGDTDVLKFSK
ncbi:MAG: hypothetical protein JNN28_11740 [Saprospiraceae bacterium]|nr:hypothetical protein [Saprospiraceae bacterium]